VDSDEEGDEELGKRFLSNKEALMATQELIQKLLEDEEIEKSVLKVLEPLRLLERPLRVQRLLESRIQKSIFVIFFC